jgi:hypothetical protein
LAFSATASINSALVMLVLYLLGTGTKVSAYPTTRDALKQASR